MFIKKMKACLISNWTPIC